LALNKLYNYGSSDKTDADHVSAMIVWDCPNAEAEGWAETLYWSNYYTFMGGSTCPKCTRVKIQYNAKPGMAWLTAVYQTIREPGRARLRGAIATRPIKSNKDTAGKIIDGPDGDGLHIWKQTHGTNFQGQSHEVEFLETAFANDPRPMLRSLRGCVNSDNLPNLGCQSDMVFVRGCPRFSMVPYGPAMQWNVDLELWINKNGWNAECKRQKQVEVVQEVFILDNNLVPTGDKSRKITLVPGKTINPSTGALVEFADEAITPYPTASMSFLDSMIKLT
jgi:hypothetical protein